METQLKEFTIKPDRNTLKLRLCSVGTDSELINKGGRMNECVNLQGRHLDKINDFASFSTA